MSLQKLHPAPAIHWTVSFYGRLFAMCVCVETLAILAGLCYVEVEIGHHSSGTEEYSQRDVAYMVLIAAIMALGFFYFAIDAVITETTFQLFMSLFAHTILCGSMTYYYFSTEEGTVPRPIALTGNIEFLGVIVFQLVYFVLVPLTKKAFGWRAYKTTADLKLQKMWKLSQLFFSVLKLDLLIVFNVLFYSTFFLYNELEDIAAAIAALVITCLLVVMANHAVRLESGPLMNMFILGDLLAPAYVGFKLYLIYHNEDDNGQFFWGFFATGALFLAVRLFAVSLAFRTRANFDHGLKAIYFPPVESDEEDDDEEQAQKRHRNPIKVAKDWAEPLLN